MKGGRGCPEIFAGSRLFRLAGALSAAVEGLGADAPKY